MNFQSKSRVTPQEKDLANMAKPSRVSITLDINLSGAQTRTSVFFFIKLENNVTHPFNRVKAPLQDL